MTRTLSTPAAPTQRERRPDLAWLTRGCETVLDLVVVVLATWTVVYHICLLLRLGVSWAVGLFAFALAGWGLLWRSRQRSGDSPRRPEVTRPADDPAARTDSSTTENVLVAPAVEPGGRDADHSLETEPPTGVVVALAWATTLAVLSTRRLERAVAEQERHLAAHRCHHRAGGVAQDLRPQLPPGTRAIAARCGRWVTTHRSDPRAF